MLLFLSLVKSKSRKGATEVDSAEEPNLCLEKLVLR